MLKLQKRTSEEEDILMCRQLRHLVYCPSATNIRMIYCCYLIIIIIIKIIIIIIIIIITITMKDFYSAISV